MSIWQECEGSKHITSAAMEGVRVVESQYVISTRKLVDTNDEQALLEEMIEDVKPALAAEYKSYSELLRTPFRYPPLDYGSRFGGVMEPSLFYGSIAIETALAEKAFYIFRFKDDTSATLQGMDNDYTAFTFKARSEQALHLDQPPFLRYRTSISSPDNYSASQMLGIAMREAGVEMFSFHSARCLSEGINIALFTPKAFTSKKEGKHKEWKCYNDRDVVSFSSPRGRKRLEFTRADFF